MVLYVRHKQGIWINYVHSIEEFREFEDILIPGRHMVIGDLALFSKPMMYWLLKLIEENSEIDCYSSKDIQDPILLSRFVNIIKDPVTYDRTHSMEDFKESSKDYNSVECLLSGFPSEVRLRVPLVSNAQLDLLQNL